MRRGSERSDVPEDVFLEVRFEILSADGFDDKAKPIVGSAVMPALARLVHRWHSGDGRLSLSPSGKVA